MAAWGLKKRKVPDTLFPTLALIANPFYFCLAGILFEKVWAMGRGLY